MQRCLSFKSKVFQLLKKRQTSLDSAYRQVRELFRYPGRAAAFFYGKLFRQFVDVFQIGYSLVRQQLVYDCPYMEYMRDMLAREQSPAWVMPFARKRMGLE